MLRGAPVVFLKDEEGEFVAHEEAEEADDELEERDLPGEAVLAEGPAPDEPEVEDGEVARLGDAAVLTCGQLQEAEAGEDAQGAGEEGVGLAILGPGGDGGLHESRAGVETGQAVTGAGDEAEDLGARVEEVEDLGCEEEAEGLGEVAEDADDGEDHPREVAVGVADEDLGGVPVVGDKGEGDADPGEEEVEGEEVGVGGRVGVRGEEVEAVVEGEEEGDDDALGDLDAVDARQHVDALGAEHGDAGHVDVVERAEVEELAEIRLQLHGDHNGRDVEVDKVDDQDGDGGKAGDPPLVSPADVEEVIANAEERNGLEGNDGSQVRSKLCVCCQQERSK